MCEECVVDLGMHLY